MFRIKLNGAICSLAARTGFPLAVSFAMFLFVPLVSSRESVRSELVQLQNHRGLRLVSVRDNKVFTVSFAAHSISQSKAFIDKGTAMYGVVSPDGTSVAISLCLDPELPIQRHTGRSAREASFWQLCGPTVVTFECIGTSRIRDWAFAGLMTCPSWR